jgi:hypothetical protein
VLRRSPLDRRAISEIWRAASTHYGAAKHAADLRRAKGHLLRLRANRGAA